MLLLTRPLPYQTRAMTLPNKLPAGFVVPAQPVEREAPPSGADWVHEIKHDGYAPDRAASRGCQRTKTGQTAWVAMGQLR